MTVKNSAMRNVTRCHLIESYVHCEGMCCLHLQGRGSCIFRLKMLLQLLKVKL